MRIFVESLKRLYEQGRTTSDKIESLFVSGKITSEEHDYIIGKQSNEAGSDAGEEENDARTNDNAGEKK